MWPFDWLFGGGGSSGRCDPPDHDWGPWATFRWKSYVDSRSDQPTIRVGFEMRRECRECSATDKHWHPPNLVEVTVDADWFYDTPLKGSDVVCGYPTIEGVDVAGIDALRDGERGNDD